MNPAEIIAARDEAFATFEERVAAGLIPERVEFGDWLAANDFPLWDAVCEMEQAA